MKDLAELLGGIKSVKFNGWEAKAIQRITEKRNMELQSIKSYLVTVTLNLTTTLATPVFLTLVHLTHGGP